MVCEVHYQKVQTESSVTQNPELVKWFLDKDSKQWSTYTIIKAYIQSVSFEWQRI